MEGAETLPLEDENVIGKIKGSDTILFGYPTQFSNVPYMVRDFIQSNPSLCPMGNLSMKEGKPRQEGRCTMCYRCISRCPKQAITLLGGKVREQCRYENYQ